MPTGPGLVALAKPRPRPSTTAVPQSGPITSSPRASAAVLSATSCSTGTLSLKSITSWPASSASIASTVALAPGTETSTSASAPASRSAAPVVRWGSRVAPPSSRLVVRVRAVSTAASAASRADVVVEPDRHHHVVGGRGREREAHLLQHLEVERRRHRDLRGRDTLDALHGAADLEQRHRVGVRTGAELDVGAVHGGLQTQGGTEQQPGARGVADVGQRDGGVGDLVPPVVGRVRPVQGDDQRAELRAAPRRAGRSRGAWPTGAWCAAGRRAARPAHRARTTSRPSRPARRRRAGSARCPGRSGPRGGWRCGR